MKDNIVGWFSLENGQHVPLKEGESKEQATKKFLSKSKVSEYKKKKQSNNKIDEGNRKITKLVKKGNTYIPIRKGENEKERIKEFKKSNSPETMSKIKKAQRDEQMEQSGVRLHLGEKGERGVAEAQKRKGTVIDYEKRVSHAEMMRFTAKNKDLIDKWANEYNTNENFRKSVDAKIMNHEGLSTKEYFSFLGSKPREGDLILSGGEHGEDVIVGKNGKLEQIPDNHYKTVNGEKYYVGKKADDFKAKKQSNNKITHDNYKEALNKIENWQTSDEEKKYYNNVVKRYEKKEKHLITRQKNKNAKENLKNELNWRGLSQEEIEKGFKLPYQDKLKKEQQKKLIQYYKQRKGK